MEDLDLGLEERPKVKGGGLFITLLVGIALGVAGTILVPRYLGDRLPEMLRGTTETMVGPVLGKRTEEGRLLLTVQAEQGALLATFREQVAEIDLLVDVGDTVSLGVALYEPFVEDPDFLGIRKAVRGSSVLQEPAGSTSGDSINPAIDAAGEAGASGEEGADEEQRPLSLPRGDQEEEEDAPGAEGAPGDTLRS